MWSRRRVWGAGFAFVAAAASSVVVLNREPIDTYACIKRVEWSVDHPAKLTNIELGKAVARWASSATVADRCFTHFRANTDNVSLAH